MSRRDGGQPRGQVDADDAGAPLGEVARDAPLPAGQVAHAQAGHVAESKEEQHVIESKGTMAATEVVDRYFAIWNEADPARRRALIEATWSPDASYLDPLYSADGPDGLDALAAGAQAQFPGHRFRLVGALDAHHDRARWGWELAAPDGAPPAVVGVDFAVLTPDGRLRAVTGFFQPPAGPTERDTRRPS